MSRSAAGGDRGSRPLSAACFRSICQSQTRVYYDVAARVELAGAERGQIAALGGQNPGPNVVVWLDSGQVTGPIVRATGISSCGGERAVVVEARLVDLFAPLRKQGSKMLFPLAGRPYTLMAK